MILSNRSFAQSTTINGYIFNSLNGRPVVYAELSLSGSSDIYYSNFKGRYITDAVPDSLSDIAFLSPDGYKIDSTIKISEDRFDIYVSEINLNNLLDLSFEQLLKLKVVTASRYEERIEEAPAIMSVITAEDIQSYAGLTLGDIIERATSTFIYGSYYLPNNMLSIRGEVTPHYTTHILLLLNGRPLRSSNQGYFLPVLRAFPVENIERIEIIRGPGSTLYGSAAYAGTVNIITKSASAINNSVSAQYGSYGTYSSQFVIGYNKNSFELSLAGYYYNSDGWNYKVRGATEDSLYTETNTPFLEESKGLNLNANFKGLTFSSFIGSNYIMIGQQSQRWWYADEWYLGTTKMINDLGYKFSLTENLKSTVNFTHNYLKYWQPYDKQANDLREWGIFNDFTLELSNHFTPGEKLSILAGGLLTSNNGLVLNTEKLSDGTPYDVWLQPKNPDPYSVIPEYSELWYSYYLNVNYKILPFLSINTGIHANKVTRIKTSFVPKFGIIFKNKSPFSLKLLYGEAFRSADFFELYAKVDGIYGNMYLQPEEIKTFEAQINYSAEKVKLSIAYFNNEQKNNIQRSLSSDSLLIVNGISQPIFINSGGLHSEGIELDGAYHFNKFLKADFSYLYHTNQNLEGAKNIFGLPNSFLKTSVSYSYHNVLRFNIYNMWVSKGNEFDDSSFPDANPKAEPYSYLCLKITSDLTRIFKLTNVPKILFEISGTNLLNESIYYPEYDAKTINTIPGRAGRAIYGGIKFNF